MSATLTWRRATAAKTGTTSAAFITDLVSAVNSVAGDPNYKWRVASSNSAATPFYVVLKRKDASAGRILIVQWSSAPAGNNPALLEVAPTTSHVYVAYFPAGNTDTPLNLTAASGTVLGDDTNATKVTSIGALATIYGTNFAPFMWDSEQAVWFTFQDVSAATFYGFGAGQIFVDKDDNDYAGVWGHAAGQFDSIGATAPSVGWTSGTVQAGGTAQHARANKGATGRPYFFAYGRLGSWSDQVLASSILYDGTISKAWFDALLMLPNVKGIGPDLKLRQVAIGPATVAAFSVFNTAGLSPAAINSSGLAAGDSGTAWFCNFKV